MSYKIPDSILQQYAKVLVRFALGSGNGIKEGEVVRLVVPECAKPFYVALRNEVLRAGGIPLNFYVPDDTSREYYQIASDKQLNFYPKAYFSGIAEQIDHSISILADTDLHELEGIDPKRIMSRGVAMKPFRDLLDKKEEMGKYTWTLALYGTEAMAKEAGISLEEYWQQIVTACFLDETDPIAKWKQIIEEVDRLKRTLDGLKILKMHIEGEDVDLWIGLGTNRQWLGGSGRNIPSFEVFTSPDWRQTEGWIKFNQPLYRYGSLIENVSLKFENGQVVEANATKNAELLREMVATAGADKVGEFSLTDTRLSRINKFMAQTLYDENISGQFGNTHIALGRAYRDAYTGDMSQVTETQWEEMGFNNSSVHTDIVSTSNRTVTAYLESGEEKVIYTGGKFTV